MSERLVPIPAYVASLAPRDATDARRLVGLVPERATAIEMRLDRARQPIPTAEILALDPRPVIVTYRTRTEGGEFSGSPEDYRRLVREAHAAGATVDVEHGSGLLADPAQMADRRRVIASHHSLFSMPPDSGERLEAMRATGARAVKLVFGAADLPSSLDAAALQARHAGEPVAIFPMGPASPPGRILSALSGSALVYGPVESPTASGQVPLNVLFDTYEVDRPRRIEALFGIVGTEVSGSLSPAIHNALFRSRGLPFLYLPLPLADWDRHPPPQLAFDPSFRGFSVTQPWKLRAAASGAGSEDVRVTKAANTLVRSSARWLAENTDVDGVFDPLSDHDTGEGRTAVIFGTGGVARAAIVAARRLGYEVLVVGRRDEAADALAEELHVDSLAAADLGRSEADLYLNATPIGSRPEDPSAFPESVLGQRPLVFDCVYRSDGSTTPTIAAARAQRCAVVEGIQMLAGQALRQARLFGVTDATLEEIHRAVAEAR